jgi:hypothetical protein
MSAIPTSIDPGDSGTATPTYYGYLFELNTTSVPNGQYTLQSLATDAAGNTAYSPGITVKVTN